MFLISEQNTRFSFLISHFSQEIRRDKKTFFPHTHHWHVKPPKLLCIVRAKNYCFIVYISKIYTGTYKTDIALLGRVGSGREQQEKHPSIPASGPNGACEKYFLHMSLHFGKWKIPLLILTFNFSSSLLSSSVQKSSGSIWTHYSSTHD